MKDARPEYYKYWDQLVDHLGGDSSKLFSGEFVWPKQIEWHLPGDHINACPLSCPHCGGHLFDKTLGDWELDGLELLNNLKGAVPWHIFGGSYSEGMTSSYAMAFLATVKKYNNSFGIHTSGINLLQLQESQAWLNELNRISTGPGDYLSISLDAGLPESWALTKGTSDSDKFNDIIEAIKVSTRIRKENGGGHAIRICYLISPASCSVENFSAVTRIAKEAGVDSLRFSIPFAHYNQSFDTVRKYKNNREIPGDELYKERLTPYLSKSTSERPYIFYSPPWFTDIERFKFNRCFYPYFQATCGADGYVYKCSTTATPTAKHCRLGKITPDLNEFKAMISANQQNAWDCQKMCFDKGFRCNRMGLEIGIEANKLYSPEGRSAK